MVGAIPFQATKGAHSVFPTAWQASPTQLKPPSPGPLHGSPRQTLPPGFTSSLHQPVWSPPPVLPREFGISIGPSSPAGHTVFQTRAPPVRQVIAPPARGRGEEASTSARRTQLPCSPPKDDTLKGHIVDARETTLTWSAFLELNPTIAANVGEAAVPGTEAYEKASRRVEEAASALSQVQANEEANADGNVTPRAPTETPLRKGMSASKAAKERQRAEAQQHKEKMERLRDAETERQRVENERLRAEAEQRRTESKRKRLEAERLRVEQKQQMARAMRQSVEEARRASEAAAEEARRASEARRTSESGRDKSPFTRRQSSPVNANRSYDPERRSASPCNAKPTGVKANTSFLGSPRPRTTRTSGSRRSRSVPASPVAPHPDDEACEEQRRRIEAESEAERRQAEAESERRRLQEEERRAKIAASRQRINDAGYAWYCVLGVSRGACEEEVKRAFRELALLHHPDKCLDGDDSTFKQIQEAYKQGIRVNANRAPSAQTDVPKADVFRPPPDRAPVFEKDSRKSGNAPRAQIPHDLLLISSSADRTARAWNCHAGDCERTLLGHTKEVVSVCCTADGKHVATGSCDRSAKCWDLETGSCKKTIRDISSLTQHSTMLKPSLASDGAHLATVGHGNHIKTWSARTGLCEQVLRGHTADVRCTAFSPSGKFLISGSNDETVRIWNLSTGKCQSVLRGHQGSITAVAFNPGGDWAGSASEDCLATIWNLCSCKPVLSLKGHTASVNSICFCPDGKLVATGSADGTARIWKLDAGECIHVISAHMSSVSSVAFSPDGSLLATGSDDCMARIWCHTTGICLQKIEGHEDVVSSVCFAARP